MGVTGTGNATPQKRTERIRLAPRAPLIESTLAGFQFDLEPQDVADCRRFGNALRAARDAWADRNRHGRRYGDKALATYRRNALARRDGGK